jgi:hypothetical protein
MTMTLMGSTPVHLHGGTVSLARRVWNFVRHFLEMCIAMCIGLAILDAVYLWLAGRFGVTDPYLRFPELTVAVVAVNMTAPMVALMRFRGMDWGLVWEMSGAMVAEAALILGAYWLGVLQNVAVGNTTTLWLWQHGLMMPVMLVPMLLRLDHYTSAMHDTQTHGR